MTTENLKLNHSSCSISGTAPTTSSDLLDARALRAEKRDLGIEVDNFITLLKSKGDKANKVHYHETFCSLRHRTSKLEQQAKKFTSLDERDILLENLNTINSSLIHTYEQWCDSIVSFQHDNSNSNNCEILPRDSASNHGSSSSVTSLTASQLAKKQIDIELRKKRLQLEQIESQKRLQLELRKAELEAEEKRLALSAASSVVSRRPDCQVENPLASLEAIPPRRGSSPSIVQSWLEASVPNNVPVAHESYPDFDTRLQMGSPQPRHCNRSGFSPTYVPLENRDTSLTVYKYQLLLEEAREIRYTGRGLPYIFFYNQITNLLQRCPDPTRKMDLLRAACQEQARETISVLVPPVPGWAVDTQIKRALESLQLRYGCCSFLSEPLVKSIRTGSKFAKIDVAALEQLISELNECELYARAYKQTNLLNSSFILDIAERLPFYLKNRYTDFLLDHCDNPDDPSFETLKEFLRRELQRMNTTFAQRLLGPAPKKIEKSVAPHKINVRQASVEVKQITPKFKSHTETSTSFTPQNKVGNSKTQQRQPPLCFICSTATKEYRHFLNECNTYTAMNPHTRHDSIVSSGHCINCLLKHQVKDCTQPCKCRHCGKHQSLRHTTSLHYFYFNHSIEAREKQGAANGTNTQALKHSGGAIPTFASEKPVASDVNVDNASIKKVHTKQTRVYTRISAIRVINKFTGFSTLAYAQHDSGSEITLVSNTLAHELGLARGGTTEVTLHTVSGSTTADYAYVSFDVETMHSGERFTIQKALVMPAWSKETYTLPHHYDLSTYQNFHDIEIQAVPDRKHVDILLGLDNSDLMTVLEERVGAKNQPHAIHTPIGWVASGGRELRESHSFQSFRVSLQVIPDERDQKIREMQETIRELKLQDEDVQMSINDKKSQEIVESKTRLVDGRYEIPVPLKDNIKSLPNNFQLAFKRLSGLRQKMISNPELELTLKKSMSNLKENQYIVPAVEKANQQVNYLPYFLTNQTKSRVVYDGSATSQGWCINDCIHSGPDLLNPLPHVLARFRKGKFALMSDLSKCFFQVRLPEEQQELFRLLWYKNDDIQTGEVVPYKFTRHVWGVISSPFIACTAIRRIAIDNPINASQLTTNTITNSMYMDDLLFSTDTIASAQQITDESIKLFDCRGFKLTKWSACRSAKTIIAKLGEDMIAPEVRTLDWRTGELPEVKAVGCIWNAEEDTLKINLDISQPSTYTRRALLSQLSKQYDPLGYYAPILLKGRLILQQLALEGQSWDESISPSYTKAWNRWLSTVEKFKDLSLPRWYFAESSCANYDQSSNVEFELHAFSDASSEAYGSVVYIRRKVGQIVDLSFVFGKGRIVLKHQQNWPIAKKELNAAIMAVNLLEEANKALNLPNCKTFCWCDSKVVMQWICNGDLRLDRFTARRVDFILCHTHPDDWHFCPTQENPADVPTRPITKSGMDRIQLWLRGPTFLKQPGELLSETHNVLKIKLISDTNPTANSPVTHGLLELIRSAPDWYTLKKRAAYLSAFTQYICQKAKKSNFEVPKLSISYLNYAMLKLVKYVQRECFGGVMKALSEEGSPDSLDDVLNKLSSHATGDATKKNLMGLRSIRCLRPYLHTDETLRIEGRLGQASLPTDEKFPIILPSKHPLTRLLVLRCHEECAHGGIQYTLMLTRRQFWIIRGLSSVRYYTGRCNLCSVKRAHPLRQLMADLPKFRMAVHRKPFTNTGCDYFGPFLYKEARSERKAWGILFTCMTTRAIHVELVTSLDLNNFILAFSRFIDVRGPVSSLYSDNGATFKAAAHVLPSLLQSSGLHSFFRKKSLSWEFIPPYSPSQGGAWESMIKVFKRTLTNTIHITHRKPTLVELQTFVSNATRIVNDRPLTSQSDDPLDHNAISPSSILTPSLDPTLTIGQPHEKDHLRSDYRYNTALAQQFWERWIKFYLPQLQRRKKWFKITTNLKVGQMVLVGGPGDMTKRGQYRLGRVVRILPQIRRGKALVRRAVVAVSTLNEATAERQVAEIERDLSKLAPLEFYE